jgi:hypothetical protein
METSRYIHTLLNKKPLERAGMFTDTANTGGKPPVTENILTTTEGAEPDIAYQRNNG